MTCCSPHSGMHKRGCSPTSEVQKLVHAAIAWQEGNTGKEVAYECADLLQSVVASIVQGLNEYGQHRGLINDRWSAAYVLPLFEMGS